MDKKSLVRGFTLIELLSAITLTTIIGAFGIAAYQNVLTKVAQTTEVSAARSLISAYSLYYADNNGNLLDGVAKNTSDITDKNGKVINKIIAKRWVPRLAAYFDYNYANTVVVNAMRKEYNKMMNQSSIMGLPANVYVASSNPSFGLNATFMGGNQQRPLDETFNNELTADDVETYGQFFVSNIAQASRPGELIVFASAHSQGRDGSYDGNEYIYAPKTTGEMRWSANYDDKADSSAFGHVHLRWSGKAVTAMLDGSVKMLDQEELKDMRHWSYQAAEANDPNWSLKCVEEGD